MSERYERVFTYGDPPVQYHRPETWTEEVKSLYKRLQEGDNFVLADLLRWDIEFLTDPKAIVAIIVLKYAPDLPSKRCRSELWRIARVIARRPNRARRKLPDGDRLEAELKHLTDVIKKQRLLEVKKDPREVQRRVEDALRNPMLDKPSENEISAQISGMSEEELLAFFEKGPGTVLEDPKKSHSRKPVPESQREEIARVVSALNYVIKVNQARIRGARSWALQAMAYLYQTGPKQIEEAISRERRAGRRRRQPRPEESTPQ